MFDNYLSRGGRTKTGSNTGLKVNNYQRPIPDADLESGEDALVTDVQKALDDRYKTSSAPCRYPRARGGTREAARGIPARQEATLFECHEGRGARASRAQERSCNWHHG